jgi:hypothetical protein
MFGKLGREIIMNVGVDYVEELRKFYVVKGLI